MAESMAPAGLAERLAGLAGTTVTFLFTDIEESTPLLKLLGERYADVSAEHRRLLRAACATHGGIEVDTQGDAFFFVFRRARDAVVAAADAQVALAEHRWPDGISLRVRMGLHSGEPLLHEEGLVGLSVVRGARICAAAHGGQVLISDTTASLLRDELPRGLSLRDLGTHRLKGLDDPQRIFQVVAPRLEGEFPPIRVAPEQRRRTPWLIAAAVLAIVAVTAGVLLLRDSSGTITVPPNALAEIDPRSARVVGSVPVGQRPVGVAFADGRIWVANGDDATVSVIEPGRDEGQTLSLGRPSEAHPVAIAGGSGKVWVALGVERRLVQLDTEFVGQLVGEPVVTGEEPLAVLVAQGLACAAVAVRVECVEASSGQPVGATPIIAAGATALADGAGTLWVGGQNAVTQFAAGTLGAIGVAIPVSGRVNGIALGGESVWAATSTNFGGGTGTGSLSRIRLGASAPSSTLELGGRPTAVVFGGDAIWVGVDNGTVLRVDPATGNVGSVVAIGSKPAALAYGRDRLWVATG